MEGLDDGTIKGLDDGETEGQDDRIVEGRDDGTAVGTLHALREGKTVDGRWDDGLAEGPNAVGQDGPTVGPDDG